PNGVDLLGTDGGRALASIRAPSTGRDRLHGQSPRASAGSCVLPRIGAGIDTEGGVSVNRRTFLTGTATSVAIGRRRLLRAAASAPVITAAGLATPSTAEAAPLPLTPPDSVDYEDVGDSIIQASAPTIVNVRLTLGADGVYTFEMPRLEQGTGISTALAMMIAEEAGGKLDALDIVTGKKKFTMDQDVPGAVPTMCRMPSQIRGTVVSVNNLATVRAIPGVLDVVVVPAGGFVVKIPPAVAVMAETFGQAY